MDIRSIPKSSTIHSSVFAKADQRASKHFKDFHNAKTSTQRSIAVSGGVFDWVFTGFKLLFGGLCGKGQHMNRKR